MKTPGQSLPDCIRPVSTLRVAAIFHSTPLDALDRQIDDPQLIFGVDLSQSDLIRNFILMRLPEKEQRNSCMKLLARFDCY
jgi:hypothetical protein